MDRSDIITLLRSVVEQDENGVEHETFQSKEVFCKVDSVTRSEFFDAGRSGLNPEYRFTLFAGDYAGETEVLYKGWAYTIYRTFFARTDLIELYAERRGGSNGENTH